MSPSRCPADAEVESARDGVGDAATVRLVRAHLGTCARCQAHLRKLAELRELALQIPVATFSPGRIGELRNEFLVALEHPVAVVPPSRTRYAMAAAAALLVGLLAAGSVALLRGGQARRGGLVQARVFPHGGARFQEIGNPQERIVRLFDGTVLCEVTEVRRGQRFRVIVGDAEVEVRGTLFEVAAAGDRLVHVKVMHGRVEVRR